MVKYIVSLNFCLVACCAKVQVCDATMLNSSKTAGFKKKKKKKDN
jgi:hypothetical protein